MTIILATSNMHKIREFQAMLGDKNARIYAYEEILKPLHIVENGATFAENAALKAKAIYNAFHTQYTQKKEQNDLVFPLALIAEDSGICIPALGGEPGIYSARYAQYKGFKRDSQNLRKHGEQRDLHLTHNSTDTMNLHCLIKQIAPFAPTPAFFVANIALIYSESSRLPPLQECVIEHFEGRLDGIAIGEARGSQGFGYDPLFVPNTDNPLQKTLAELAPSVKNMLSHRKKAISLCIKRLNMEKSESALDSIK